MQIKQTICDVEVEFHQAPFHQTNTVISFKQGDTEVRANNVDTLKDYNPLFEAMHVKGTYTHGDVTFSWLNNDMQVVQGDKKVILKNITDKPEGYDMSQYEILCFLAFGRCIDPY